MKNKKILLFIFLISIFLFPKNVGAITASMSCSSSGSVTLGNTIKVTISGSASSSAYWQGTLGYDSSKLQLVSGNVSPFTDSATASPSFTYTFKSISAGNAYVKMANMNVSDETGSSEVSISSSTCNITVKNPEPVKPKNSDNNLKSLSIEGVNLTPEFNKDTLEYTVELESDVTKVKINAEKNDSTASVSGTGEKEVQEGNNKLEIIVTAENGSTKTYIINAIVKEKNPIVVKIGKEKYNVVRKKDVIEAPEGYEETTVVIKDEEIPAYSNSVTGYLLVGLTNEKGESAWYIYDESKKSYSKYTELKSNTIRLVLLTPKKSEIPYKYYEDTFEFNNQMIDGYTFDSGSDFRLIYAMNVETGEKLFYVYDIKDKTLQRFYNDQVLIYIELVKKCKYLLIGIGITCLILFMLLIISLSKNVKFKKNYLNKIDNIPRKQKEEVEYKDIESTKVIDAVDFKKEQKKQIKEDKKRFKQQLKNERKTFLDE